MSMVIIFGISAHYMQLAKALDEEAVTFSIETVTGDEALLQDKVLQTSYYDRYMGNWAYVSTDGAKEIVDHQFGSSLYRAYEPFEFKRYLKEYRSFMRGKELIISQYYEDEQRLVYVTAPSGSKPILKGEQLVLVVDVLTKDTNERVKFEAKALAKSGYSWLQVEDVRVADGVMSVLVVGSGPSGETDLQLYTIDEATKQVTNTETLLETNDEGDMSSSIYYYGDTRVVGNTNYHVYQQNSWTYDEKTGHEKERRSDFYMYSYETKRIDVIPTTALGVVQESFQADNVFYAVTLDVDAAILHAYDLAGKKWAEPLRMPLKVNVTMEADQKFTLNFERTPYLQVIGEHVYVANPVGDTNELFVYALTTGDLVYSGVMTVEGASDLAEMYVEQIYQISK